MVARIFAFLVALLVAGLHAPDACAHAALVKAEPSDGAVIAAAPPVMRLTFNEPVSPLVVRLLDPTGAPIAPAAVITENATVTISLPPELKRGTHVLSWRVVSTDGHPVGGSLIFSIGAPSAQPETAAKSLGDTAVRALFWAARLVIYAGLLIGVGGAVFRAWIADPGPPRMGTCTVALLAAALMVVPFSVGLQGLDALDRPLGRLLQKSTWQSGFETSYGRTAIAAACALFSGLLSLAARSVPSARGFAGAGLVAVGIALAISGHASTAEPRLVSRAALFVHGVCVTFWIGSLLPLYAGARAHRQDGTEFARFSRAIPLAVALVLMSGGWLAVVQLERLDALWTTDYGQVLACKLAAVIVLLGLAAANRFWLVPGLATPGARTARAFAASLAFELAIALVILGLVALWRFTPPPRSHAAATPISIHIHGEKAMAEIEVGPEGGLGARHGARLLVLDGTFRPLAVKEVALVLANPAAGIEPMRRIAVPAGEGNWRIEHLQIPVAGRWKVQVEMLISDFEKVTIEDTVTLPRLP